MPHQGMSFLTEGQLAGIESLPTAFDIPNGGWACVYDPVTDVRRGPRVDTGHEYIIKPAKTMRLVKYDAATRKASWTPFEKGMTITTHAAAYKKDVMRNLLIDAMADMPQNWTIAQASEQIFRHMDA